MQANVDAQTRIPNKEKKKMKPHITPAKSVLHLRFKQHSYQTSQKKTSIIYFLFLTDWQWNILIS